MDDHELEKLLEEETVERFSRLAEQAQRDLSRLSTALFRAADVLDHLAAIQSATREGGNVIPFRPRGT